jgi:hypothetical protein
VHDDEYLLVVANPNLQAILTKLLTLASLLLLCAAVLRKGAQQDCFLV